MTTGSLIAERSVLKTAPAIEPVTLAEAKLHLRVTHSATDDKITSLIVSARRRVEQDTGRALITQTWYLYADGFPYCDRFVLPKAPLISITSIKYTDSAGTQTTFDAASWDADTTPTPGELVLTYGSVWPISVLSPTSPIVIEYVAGFGATAALVPEPYKDAMKLVISMAFEFPEPVITGTIVAKMPMSYDWLIANEISRYF